MEQLFIYYLWVYKLPSSGKEKQKKKGKEKKKKIEKKKKRKGKEKGKRVVRPLGSSCAADMLPLILTSHGLTIIV